MKVVITLGWRNLWRNHRRTIIILAAISLGVWAMIFMTALMRGMVGQMVKTGTETFVGHVQVHHAQYRSDPSIANSMPPPGEQMMDGLDTAKAWTTRVRVPAMISSERESRGVTLMGIRPQREAPLSFIASGISAGRYLESPSDDGLIIGQQLARELDTELGKRVVLMSQDPQNNIVDRGFRIVGIYEASLNATEELYVFIGMEAARKFLDMGSMISEIEAIGDDYRNTDNLYRRIRAAAPDALEVLPWYELDAYLGIMLATMDGFVLVWMVVIFVALSFGLINTLFMAVFERVREIGLMLALGMRPRQILSQILVEALFLLALGLAIGTGAAWLAIKPLEDGIDVSAVAQGMEMMGASSVLYPSLQIKDIVMANLVVIVLGLLASLFPAWVASRYKPVDAMTKT